LRCMHDSALGVRVAARTSGATHAARICPGENDVLIEKKRR
jgi:hypothetical protein